jgi:membrane protease YdiL (CAAX protease family)
MFIEQGIKKSNEFWKYILGSIFIIGASALGQIPLGIAVAVKSLKSGKIPTNTNDAINLLDSNLSLFLIMLSFVFGFIGLVLVVKYFHKQSLLEVTTSRKKVDWYRVFFSFGLWALFTIIITLITYYANPGELVWNFKPVPFAILFVIATLLIPIQTSTEEYIFRGYLMQGFANLAKNKWFPLVMTSVIFGSMHILNPEVENLITALLVTSDWTALRTNSLFKDTSTPGGTLEIFIPVLVIYPILLFIFSKKYQWTNWKEKLTGKIIIENNTNTEYHD